MIKLRGTQWRFCGCKIGGPQRRVGEVSEKSITRQQAGSSDGQNEPWEPAILAGACSGGKFVVSMAGEAYDAHEEEVQIGNSG